MTTYIFGPPPNDLRGFRPRFHPLNSGRRFKGGGKGGSSDVADMQRADEAERQKTIRGGTQRINDIFNGTSQGINPATTYDPSQTYYNGSGEVFRPSTPATASAAGPFGATPGQDAGMGDPNSLLANGKLFTGTQKSGGFDEGFYDARKQAYLDYANPQVDSQYQDAVKNLTFALGRNGLLDSSVRADKSGKLQKEYDTQRQGVADKALDYETQARNQVEQSRQNLISTLNATGDATGAANSAMTQAQTLQAAPAFDPIASLFGDATAGIATQAQLEARNNANYTGVFKRSPGASSTVVS